MDSKLTKEILQKLQDSVKDYTDIEFKFSIKEDIFSFKVEIVGADPIKFKEHQERIEKANERVSKGYGFTQNIIGMEFESRNSGGVSYHRITGFKPRNPKYPIITIEISTGKSYKFPVESVKTKLGGDKLINRNANLEKLLEK
jgi:hypothetical protein